MAPTTTTTMTHCNRTRSNSKQPHPPPHIRTCATKSPAAAPAIATLGKQVTTATLSHAMPATDLQAYLAEVYTVRAVATEITAPNKTVLVATAPMSSLPALASSSKVSVVNYAIAPSALSSSPLSPSSSGYGDGDDDDDDDDDADHKNSNDSTKASKDEDDLQILLGFALLTRYDSTAQLEPEPEPCLAQHLPSAASSIQLQRLYIGAFGRGMGVGARLMRAVETVACEEKRTNMWLQVSRGNLAAQKAYERWGFERVGECEIDVGGFGQRGWVMGKGV